MGNCILRGFLILLVYLVFFSVFAMFHLPSGVCCLILFLIFIEDDMNKKFSLRSFLASESGATAVEYAFLAAGIAVVIGGAVTAFGGSLKTGFTDLGNTISAKVDDIGASPPAPADKSGAGS